MNDCKLSGSQEIGGGEYARVSGSGSLKINGSIKCEEMRISGSCKVEGSIDCENEIYCSGSFSADGKIAAKEFGVSGSSSFGGFSGGILKCSGSICVKGDIKAKEVEQSGSLSCKNLEADSLDLSGKIAADGQINSEKVRIKLSCISDSRAESVVGSKIKIYSAIGSRVFGFIRSYFETQTIEGDDIDLDYVVADCVRGKDIRIGKHCRIKRVEASGSLYVDDKAEVGEKVKI